MTTQRTVMRVSLAQLIHYVTTHIHPKNGGIEYYLAFGPSRSRSAAAQTLSPLLLPNQKFP